MRFLLVSPAFDGLGRYHFPMGLAMISSVLKAAGHDVHCRNLDLEDDWESAFAEDMKRLRPAAVGCGGMTPSFGFIRRLFDLAKQLIPSVATVLGGGLLGSEPLVLSAMQADIGVLGEGEDTAVELAARLESGQSLLDVPGLLLKNPDGSLLRTPERPYVKDLDSLPLPDYHGFGFGECLKRNPFQAITTSRGCPFHCTFCYCVMGRGKHRFNSIGRVIDELAYLKSEFGLTNIGLIDEIFALKKERIVEFCERVKPLGLAWSTQVRVEIVDRQLLGLMRECGCTLLFYGLESMCPTVLKNMNKRLKPEQVARALEDTYQSGLRVFGNFIFGDPAETTDTAWETLEWWLAHRKYGINLGKIDCWPGTAIYKQALERGVIADPLEYVEKGCPLVNLTSMPRPEWVAMLRRVWTFHESMTFPCKVERVQPDEDGGAADCVCPHCKITVRVTGLNAIPVHADRGAQRVGCPACPFEFDMPIRIPPQVCSPINSAAFENAISAFLDCSLDKPVRIEKALEHLDASREQAWDHPLAAYLAAFCLLLKGYGQDANEIARRGLRHNPTAPYLLDICAVSYRRLGDLRMSTAFLRQAQLIRKAREVAVAASGMDALDPFEARFKALFPSDAVNLDAGVEWS
ncbi:MAG: radical SAM protein [Thermodesulfobacteriota bacterium]